MDVYFEEETSPSNSSNLLHRGPKIFVSTLFKASAVFDHFSQMHPTLTRLRFLQDGFSFGVTPPQHAISPFLSARGSWWRSACLASGAPVPLPQCRRLWNGLRFSRCSTKDRTGRSSALVGQTKIRQV